MSLLLVGAAARPVSAYAQGPSADRRQLDTSTSNVIQQAQPSLKDPGTATILSVVITGAGQMYAGDVNRGLLMLGSAYGAIIAGAILSHGASCDFNPLECSKGSYAPLYVGALAAVGVWVYGIVDAAPTTRRMNAKRGLAGVAVPPIVVAAQQRLGLGLRVPF
jgi:hypothetical protein